MRRRYWLRIPIAIFIAFLLGYMIFVFANV